VAEATSLRADSPTETAADAGPEVAAADSEDLAPAEADAGGMTPVMAETDQAPAAPDSRSRGRGRGGRESGSRREPRTPREPRAPREARSTESRNGDGRPEPRPFVPAKPMEELSEGERATLEESKAVLEELLRLMEVPGTVEVAMGTEAAKLNVVGEDLGVLIGRRGEKLASLQHIVNLIVARREGQLNRIMVDVENYRGRREDQLRDVADRAAQRVAQSGKIIQLEAMPAMERRIVHLALAEHDSVRTQSVGVEPNRRVVILPANKVG
jgi:spoIIIJ-associated protein